MDDKTGLTKNQLLAEIQTLRANEEKYRSMFENMINGVALHKIVTNEKGKPTDYVFMEINESFEQLTDLKKEEIIGKKVTEVLPGIDKDPANWIEKYGEVALKGKEIRFENYSEPIKRWYSIHAYCPKEGYFVTIFENITEQKRIENELKESEERFRKIYHDSPDMYVSVSPTDATILQCNNTLIAKTGYTREEIIGSPVYNMYHQDCMDEVRDAFRQFVEKGEVVNKELILKRKDGNKVFVSLNVSSVKDSTGNILYSISSWRDISDRIIARQKFLHEKNKAQQYLDVAGVMLVGLDPNGVVQLINKKGCQILGYEEEEILGKNWIDNFVPKHEIEKLGLKRKSFFSGDFNSFKNYENRIKTKSGEERLIAWNNAALTDGEGKIIGTISSGEDITEKRQMEEELKRSEIKYRNLYNNAPIPYHSLDEKGNFIEVNPAWLNTLGYTKKEVIGKNYGDFLHPNWKEHFKTKFQIFKKAGSVQTKFKIQHKQGHYIDIDLNGSIVYNLDGSFKQTNCVFQDITERKKAEKDLKESEYKFRLLADSVNDWEYWLNEKNKYVFLSKSCEKITGYKKEEFIENPELLFDIIHPGDKEKMHQHYHDELHKRKGPVFKTEFRIFSKDGTLKWIEHTCNPVFNEENKFLGRRGNNRDITDRKKTEKELVEAKIRTEESDRLKSAFLANMSHEIRTPMNGILGFTNLLQQPNLSGEEQQAYIQIIKTSGDRMLNTVNDIVEISKIETGQVKLTIKEVDISKLLDFHYNFFKPEVERKGMEINMCKSIQEHEEIIYTDESKLNSVLTNLIKNAIKYSIKGSIEICCKKNKGFLEFTVKDTGIGIPKERQKAIFDRFVQADIEDKLVHEGSGLGLTISKSYVEMLGGKIWVQSEPEKGSTFSFTIEHKPVKHPEIVSQKEDVNTNNINSKEKIILIAEDDEVSYLLLESILSIEDYKLHWAKDGKETIKMFKESPVFDLVIMDLKMPVMDGIEATRKIREFNKHIPIIAQTAYALEGDKEKAIEAGCTDYITKPVNRKELIKKIAKAISA